MFGHSNFLGMLKLEKVKGMKIKQKVYKTSPDCKTCRDNVLKVDTQKWMQKKETMGLIYQSFILVIMDTKKMQQLFY